jgi:glycosyltransferase involved in cell wall biosynthesis
MPSRWEGHPKALLEAMSCGLPCVAVDAPGARDVLRSEVDGLLVPDDPTAFAGALDRVRRDRELAERLGAAARATVEERFDARALIAREVELLRSLAERRLA